MWGIMFYDFFLEALAHSKFKAVDQTSICLKIS